MESILDGKTGSSATDYCRFSRSLKVKKRKTKFMHDFIRAKLKLKISLRNNQLEEQEANSTDMPRIA